MINGDDSDMEKMSDPILYILIRNDTESMGNGNKAGRAIAQGSHAANQMTFDIITNLARTEKFPPNEERKEARKLGDMLQQWRADRGFGTAIVLEASWGTIVDRVGEVNEESGIIAGIVVDETYPIRDGEVVHLINFPTCAYLFGDKQALRPYTEDLKLFP